MSDDLREMIRVLSITALLCVAACLLLSLVGYLFEWPGVCAAIFAALAYGAFGKS